MTAAITDVDATIAKMNDAIRKTASERISKKEAIKREFDLSQDTKDLFDEGQTKREHENWEKVEKLTKEIRKAVRRDRKKNFLINKN